MRNVNEFFIAITETDIAIGGYVFIAMCMMGVIIITLYNTNRKKPKRDGVRDQMNESFTKCFINLVQGFLLLWFAGSMAIKGETVEMVLLLFPVIFSFYESSLAWNKFWKERIDYVSAPKKKKGNCGLFKRFASYVARKKAFFLRRNFVMKIWAIMPILLSGTSLLSAACVVALEQVGISDDIVCIFWVAFLVTLFLMLVDIAPIPLAWNKPYLAVIKKTGAVHYTNAIAAQNIKKEGFIRPSNRRDSYSNLFRKCAYLASPKYREVTLSYNKMKGKVEADSIVIHVPYNEETFRNAKFRLVDMSIMISGGIKL